MSLSLPTGLDVRADVWYGVLQFLLDDPRAMLSLTQTCTGLHDLADHEQVWQSVAAACWGHLAAAFGRTSYRTYKRLVMDDNRANAALALAFNSTACVHRFQRMTRFYECRLLQLQWWRTPNSLRLYFDARGEGDLSLPMSSSIAVIRLRPGSSVTAGAAAAEHQQPSSSSSSSSGGNATTQNSLFDLDAMGTRLLVHAPDACHTFVQKPGHYKGVLIWHSSKTMEILKALLLQQAADSEVVSAPPQQQHSPVQAGRRSEAWEEWADYQLQQEEENGSDITSNQTGSSSSSCSHHTDSSSSRAPACGLLRSCLRQWCSAGTGGNSSSSSSTACCSGNPATEAGPNVSPQQAAAVSSSSSQQCAASHGGPKHALVFCYANDLKWYHTMHTPDYSITPLAVAQPQPGRTDDSPGGVAPVVPPRLCPSPQGRPYKQRGQVSKHLQRRNPHHDVKQMSKREEGELAAAWKRLPGAVMHQPGALDQQLQAESLVQEKLRWSSLPAGVKARGEGWWV